MYMYILLVQKVASFVNGNFLFIYPTVNYYGPKIKCTQMHQGILKILTNTKINLKCRISLTHNEVSYNANE
jgi:hypothetical protein